MADATRLQRHGVGVPSEGSFPGDVQHLVSPIIGMLRLLEADREPLAPGQMGWLIDRLELIDDLAQEEHARGKA